MAQGEHWVDVARRVVANHQHETHDGVLLDAFTASAMVAVHDGLSPEPRAVYRDYSTHAAAHMALRLANSTRSRAKARNLRSVPG